MPIAAERLEVEVRADTSQASRELDGFYRDAQGNLTRTNSAMGRAGSAGQRMGNDISAASNRAGRSGSQMGEKFRMAGRLVGAAAGAMVVAVGGKAVMAASDLNEVMSKTGVVFGPQAKTVTDAAQEMADKFGIGKTEFLDAASGIGLVGKASGLTQKEAAKLGTGMGKLAADASSFYDVPVTEALDAMKSGLVGEAEPMRRFGVLLSEAAVQSEAARLGIADMGSELTEGQKVQARSSLIMRGMSDASGDLERTQSSVSNRLREIRGRLTNFAADMGTKALPAAEKLLGALIKAPRVIGGMAKAVVDWATGSATVRPVLDLVVAAVSGLIAGVGKVPGAFAAATGWIKGFLDQNAWLKPILDSVAVAVAGFVTGFLAVLALAKVIGIIRGIAVAIRVMSAAMLANPIGLIVGALVALALVAYAAYKRFAPFRELVNGVGRAIMSALAPAVAWFRQALPQAVAWVMAKWRQFGPGIVATLVAVKNGIAGFIRFMVPIWKAGFTALVNVARNVWNVIKGVVRGGVNVIKGVVNVVMGVIKGDWGRVWKGIQQILSGVWGAIKSVVKGGVGVLKSIISGGLSILRSIWSGAWNAVKGIVSAAWGNIKSAVSNGASAVVGYVRELPGRIKSGLGNLGTLLLEAGRDVVRGLSNGIRDMAADAAQAAAEVAGNLARAARAALKIFSPSRVFAKIGKNVVAGLVGGIRKNSKGADKAARALAKKVVDGFTGSMSGPAAARFGKSLDAWARNVFSGGTERRLLGSIRSIAKRTRKAIADEEKVTTRLRAALARKAGLTDQRDSMVDAMSQGISSQANVLNSGADAGTIRESLGVQVAKVREFVANLKSLKSQGWSRGVIAQVAGAGIEGGAEVAKALLAASSEDRAAINDSFSTITKVAATQSKALGASLYGEGIRAADGIADGLTRRRKTIMRRIKSIGDALGSAIQRALGVAAGGGKRGRGRRPMEAPRARAARGVVQVTNRPRPPADPKAGPGGGRPPFTPAATGGGGNRRGDVHFTFQTHNPKPEKQSQTTNKALTRVAVLGFTG